MDYVFLSAEKAIVKRYELDSNGDLEKHSYPFVYEVSSHVETVSDLAHLEVAMKKHAALGNCMLKGNIARPLVKESRAGSTNPDEKTDWICLDLDGVDNFQTVDLFLTAIGCQEVDYILQWSSSMGIEANAGFRCHIFMLLAQPQHPQLLKHWLMDLNLSIVAMSNQLELTKTGNALKFPLDITTCQNDKLLYIAPPQIGKGITDPFPGNQRIQFVKKKSRRLKVPYPIPTRDALRQRIDARVNEIRVATGMPKRKVTKYKFAGTVEYMANPDASTVTDVRVERGFVYFNLNGGDSWAYYHPENNPDYVYNFKGEPVYRTEELLPDYWAQLKQQTANYAPNSKGLIYLAFRDFRSSNYYNGTYDTGTEKLVLAMAKSESQLRHFMKQHGQPLGECVPDWDLIWNPHSAKVVDADKHELNMYAPSEFEALAPAKPKNIPSTIKYVIEHVMGHDQRTIDHFLNWLAVIVQFKTRTGTAWVWQGTQGTGKGVLFHNILTPLLNEPNVVSKRMDELDSEFTGFMENKFLVFIDEIEAGKSLYHNKITAKLKNLIVEPTISIRKMYSPPYMAENFSSMIFASNKPGPVEVAPDDRRFNVAPYQNDPISLTATEVDDKIPRELATFYRWLMNFKANPDKARKPLISDARKMLIDINRTAIDTVVDALYAGDMQFLWDHLPTNNKEMNALSTMKVEGFKVLMKEIIEDQPAVLTRDDLFVLLDWCIGNMPQSPHKFTALLKHHRVHLTQVWKDNRNVRGIDVAWKADPIWLAGALKEVDKI
jgi:hypothetical protein